MLIFLMNGDYDHDIENYTRKQTIAEAMKQLIPEYEEVIRLKYFEDLTQEEIAGSLGVSQGTVKSRLYRAKRKLGKIIEETRRI